MPKKLTTPSLFVGPPSDTADIQYLTGFTATDPVALLLVGGKRTLVVPDLELVRARSCDPGARVLLPSELPKPPEGITGVGAWLLGLLCRARVRRVRVSRWFPVAWAKMLEQQGVRLEVSDGALLPERERKRANEITALEKAQRVAIRCMRSAIAIIGGAEIGPGGWLKRGRRRLCSEDVREEIERVAMSAGCLCAETIVAGGEQAVNPHERGRGPLRAGEAIVLDIFPRDRRSGYWGDLTRTVARGAVSDKLRRMYAAVAAAQDAAKSAIRAGVPAEKPDAEARRALEKAGFQTVRTPERMEGFIHGTGHGVGLDIHEAPALRAGGGFLRAGHVVTVEPGLYYPGVGGIRIEDIVLVTATGYRPFPTLARRFELDRKRSVSA